MQFILILLYFAFFDNLHNYLNMINLTPKTQLTYQRKCAIMFIVGWAITHYKCEESPSTTEQSRLITSSQGDLRKSATERYRQAIGKGEKVR